MAISMDLETYRQYEVLIASIEEELKYLSESVGVKIQSCSEEVVGLTLPTTVILCVAETQLSIKGAIVTGLGKPAITEAGLVVNILDSVGVDELLEINIAEGAYLKRAKQVVEEQKASLLFSFLPTNPFTYKKVIDVIGNSNRQSR